MPIGHAARAACLACAPLILAAGPTAAAGPGPAEPQAPIPRAGEVAPYGRADAADLMNGQYVVVSGGGAGQKAACLTCHGVEGQGDAAGNYPRLAGQPWFYLYKQLQDYAVGTRPNPIMSDIAKGMSAAEMLDVSVWYATAEAPAGPPHAAPAELLRRGAQLAQRGDPELGVQACDNCHGAGGAGVPPSFPYLAGQYAPYIAAQLQLWRQGVRENDPLNSMHAISLKLRPADIAALAAWYASRPPPDPVGPLVAADR